MMKGRICLITGGNAGIGKATAAGLAKKNATIVIVTRNDEKGEEAVNDIRSASGNDDVSYLTADLSSQNSIRNLAVEYKSKFDSLHVLVNNAGVYYSDLKFTEDNIEMQFAVNHLAPFLLTNLLLDLIKASAPSRIVNVSSRAHYRGKINFEDPNHSKNYNGYLKAYTQSKLANVLFTNELARMLEGTGVTANSLHPGVVKTTIARKNSSAITNFFWGLYGIFMITPEEGSKTSVFLASSPEVEGISGKYFEKSHEKRSSELSHDEETARRLWEMSEKMVGLV